MTNDVYYYAIFLTILLKSVAFIPTIIEVNRNKLPVTVSYLTLFLNLITALISCIIAIYKEYYFHIILFFIYFCSVAILIQYKYESHK